MTKKHANPPLTPEELETIRLRRAEANARARAALATMTDEEDAAIHAAALGDPDAQPLPDDVEMGPAHEVAPHLVAAQLRGRGRPKLESPKEKLAIRLDPEVIEAWRASGPGWQTRMGETLRKHAPKRSVG